MQEDKQKTEDRLKEGFSSLDKTYSAWISNKSDKSARDNLQQSLQETRRVLARIEIELARSESSERSHRPVPIPEHRSNKKQKFEGEPGNTIEVQIKDGSKQKNNRHDSRSSSEHPSSEQGEEDASLPAFVVGGDNGDGGKKTLRARTKKDEE